MSWTERVKAKTISIGDLIARRKKEAPVECKSCGQNVSQEVIDANLHVCPHCDHHFRINARQRIHMLLNPRTFVEYDENLISVDPLKFRDKKKYKDRLQDAMRDGSKDAIVCGTGRIGEHTVEICVFDFKFMGGSMGSVVGEKITRSIERAIRNLTPLIIVSCSGGARMQEGILSLMQMAKTSAALERLAEKRVPYISVLTDPTTGGVSASFAFLGDIIVAEPDAMIGFAGARVIEQTINQKLPEGFQTAEFVLEHGLIDRVTHRRDLRPTLEKLLSLLLNRPILPAPPSPQDQSATPENA